MDVNVFFVALIGILVVAVGFANANKIKKTAGTIAVMLASIIIGFLFMVLLGWSFSMSIAQSVLMGRYWTIMLIIFLPIFLIYNNFIRNKTRN